MNPFSKTYRDQLAKWYDGIKNLKSGHLCEVKFPARSYWMKARLLRNGASGYWEAELTEEVVDDVTQETYPVGHRVVGIYAEHVRAIETP